MLSLHKYSPFNKDITTLLSCQYVGFLKWHVFSVPDYHPQLITKVKMNLKFLYSSSTLTTGWTPRVVFNVVSSENNESRIVG